MRSRSGARPRRRGPRPDRWSAACSTTPTGWQGLFWIDAVIAAGCIPITLRTVAESRDPNRSRSIDFAGTVAGRRGPRAVRVRDDEGLDLGWLSVPTLGCLRVAVVAAVGFVAVERRVAAPLVDLRAAAQQAARRLDARDPHRGRGDRRRQVPAEPVLPGPGDVRDERLDAGLATLPVAAWSSDRAGGHPAGPPFRRAAGDRHGVRAADRRLRPARVVKPSWAYAAFLGRRCSRSPSGSGCRTARRSSIATASVPVDQVGAASGISNMARYVGGAVMTAVVAGIYASTNVGLPGHRGRGRRRARRGLSHASSPSRSSPRSGSCSSVRVARRPPSPHAVDYAAAAASTTHTLPLAARA